MQAVMQHTDSFRFASADLQNSKEFVLEMVKRYVMTFTNVCKEFRNDKDIVLAAVIQNGESL